jgi:hypothetical protein
LGWITAFVFAAVLAALGGVMWLLVDPGRDRYSDSRSIVGQEDAGTAARAN